MRLISFIILACCFIGQLQAVTDWQHLAEEDLNASHQLLSNNAIGAVDQLNPHFRQWLEQGYRQTLQQVKAVKTMGQYRLVMNRYINGFHDQHIQYIPYLAKFSYWLLWPGFTVYYHYGHWQVWYRHRPDNKQFSPNTELLSCDGISAEQLFRTRVLPYFGMVNLMASWQINSSRLLFYTPNPWYRKLQHCRFSTAGHVFSDTLHWRRITSTLARDYRMRAAFSYQGKFATRPFMGRNGVWVNLPTFLPQGEAATKLQAMIHQASKWRNKQWIVLDTRGNLGGNVNWGAQLLNHLYGKAYIQQQLQRLPPPVYQWRLSQRNLAELADFYQHYIKSHFGVNSQVYENFKQQLQVMQHSWHQGKLIHPTTVKPLTLPIIKTRLKNPVKAKVLWLTDARCSSSCLTFGDWLSTLPNIIQIGQATNADTYYTESVVEHLPSGARLYYPIKVQHYRLRASNQPYYPAWFFTGDINQTAAINKWLKKIITGSN